MEKIFKLGPGPHIKTAETVNDVMRDVIIALMPALIAAIYFFKMKALLVVSISVISALISEAVCQKIMGKKIEISDGSAVVTGLLFAFVVTPVLPLWMAVIGASISIILGKMVFGGLGHNIFNPALIGRTFLMASWPVAMTSWIKTDGTAGATVLGVLKLDGYNSVLNMFDGKMDMYWQLFIGNRAGSIGETSVFALLIGAAYLLYKKHITLHTPISYIVTVFILSMIFKQDPIFHVLSGGLIIGAFFMATDMVTTPYTSIGRIIFGIGAGILVVWIRLKGGYPEGVCYSILIMNALTPILNRYTRPKVFGEVKNNG